MTCVLLLVALPSKRSCRRQHILGLSPRHWLLRQSCQQRYAVDTCSVGQAHKHRLLVTPFLLFVCCRFRMVLYTGFGGDEPWSETKCQAPILSHFGQATTLRRLVICYDASDVPSLALSMATS